MLAVALFRHWRLIRVANDQIESNHDILLISDDCNIPVALLVVGRILDRLDHRNREEAITMLPKRVFSPLDLSVGLVTHVARTNLNTLGGRTHTILVVVHPASK